MKLLITVLTLIGTLLTGFHFQLEYEKGKAQENAGKLILSLYKECR